MKDYQLKQALGSGLFSTVWEACQETKCPYAVKVIIIRPENLELPDIIWPSGPAEVLLPLYETTSETNFWREVKLMQVASELGAAPTYYSA